MPVRLLVNGMSPDPHSAAALSTNEGMGGNNSSVDRSDTASGASFLVPPNMSNNSGSKNGEPNKKTS